MERKFLAVSLLVFLIALGYYIYTSYQSRSEQNQPVPVEEEPTVFSQPGIRVKSNDSSDTPSAKIVEEEDSLHSSDASGETVEETEVPLNTAGSDPVEETDENQLSPELEALFSTFHSLDEKIQALSVVFDPLINESISIDDRQIEISRELNPGPDHATQQALNEERSALFARAKEITPRIFELQDEIGRLTEEHDALLGEYGFSSRKGFFETHREEYKAWKAAQ